MNGYVSTKSPRQFQCSCGNAVSVPGYTNCKCGKIWNSYVIGTGGDRHEAAAEKFICREIPVRDNVIVANRKVAGGWLTDHAFQGPALAPEEDYCMGAHGGGDCGLPASLHQDFERDNPDAMRNKNIREIEDHRRRKGSVRSDVIVANKRRSGFPAGGSGEYDKALNDFEHQSDSEDFPSDHHPKAGEATMSTPASDWHHRDRGGKWTQ